MAVQYLYQIIFCSERTGRAARREIAISERTAMVTQSEGLPPGYEYALANMRQENERIYRLYGNLECSVNYKGCTFCGNRGTFHCPCGILSCISVDRVGRQHCCPHCKEIFDAEATNEIIGSQSGFIDGQGRRPLPPSRPVRTMEDVRTEPEPATVDRWKERWTTPGKSIFDIEEPVLRQVSGPERSEEEVTDWDFLKIDDGARQVRQLPGPEPQRRLPAPSGGKTKLLDWLDKKKKDGDR